MDYSKIFFNKSIDEIRYEDIVNYFSEEREENTKIEFKSYSERSENFEKNLEGIIRGICAFLNSEGGILIWGAPMGSKVNGKNKTIFKGQLSPVTELKNKDWLINKISDLITPLPIGIKVSDLKDESNYIYVFEIQQSNYSPHQFKNTYFARLDGQTKPAPHYLIEALFKKIHYPNIEGFIKLDSIDCLEEKYILDIAVVIFNFSPLQNEENVSFRLMCLQGKFARHNDLTIKFQYRSSGHQLIYNNFVEVLHFGQPHIHTEQILFNSKILNTRFNNKIEIILSFGGKYSPLKMSSYTLDINSINLAHKKLPNYLISNKEENILFIDKQNVLGATRESILQDVLNS